MIFEANTALAYRKFKNLQKGDPIESHDHYFDHDVLVMKGSVRVYHGMPDGSVTTTEAHAPANVLIKKHWIHSIEALADDTEVWCAFAHRFKDGTESDECEGNKEAYC